MWVYWNAIMKIKENVYNPKCSSLELALIINKKELLEMIPCPWLNISKTKIRETREFELDEHVVWKFYRHIGLTITYGAKFENGDVLMNKVIYRIASLQKKRECALVFLLLLLYYREASALNTLRFMVPV